MKKIVIIFLVIASVICAEQCQPEPKSTSRNFHRYTWANFNQFKGNLDEAEELFKQEIEQKESIPSLKGYINSLNIKKEYAKIASLLEKKFKVKGKESLISLDELYEHDADMQFLFAFAYLQLGKQQQAERRFIAASKQFNQHPEIMLGAVEAYVHNNDTKNALITIDNFINCAAKKLHHFVFFFLKAQLYTQAGDFANALEWIKKTVKANSRFPQAWLLKAILEEKLGASKKSEESFKHFFSLTGISNPEVIKQMIELSRKQFSTIDSKSNRLQMPNLRSFKKSTNGSQTKNSKKIIRRKRIKASL